MLRAGGGVETCCFHCSLQGYDPARLVAATRCSAVHRALLLRCALEARVVLPVPPRRWWLMRRPPLCGSWRCPSTCMSRCAAPYCAVLCRAMLCCAVLCCAVLWLGCRCVGLHESGPVAAAHQDCTLCRMERQCRMCHPSGVVVRRQHAVAVSPTRSTLLTTSRRLPVFPPSR